MASVTFKRGTKAEIEATAKQDGQILMETDQTNNKMYVDLQNNNRVRIGNSNVDDISGITDSLTATSSNIALSAAGGNNLQGQIDTLNSNLTQKKLGDFQFIFPSSWNSCAIEGATVKDGLVIKANSDASVSVTFRNKYAYLPLVVPIVYSTTGTWGYITAMPSSLTKTGCELCFHNFDDVNVIVCVGYIIVG